MLKISLERTTIGPIGRVAGGDRTVFTLQGEISEEVVGESFGGELGEASTFCEDRGTIALLGFEPLSLSSSLSFWPVFFNEIGDSLLSKEAERCGEFLGEVGGMVGESTACSFLSFGRVRGFERVRDLDRDRECERLVHPSPLPTNMRN